MKDIEIREREREAYQRDNIQCTLSHPYSNLIKRLNSTFNKGRFPFKHRNYILRVNQT
jgi:hypothetical protein